jgi:hypothetical protein
MKSKHRKWRRITLLEILGEEKERATGKKQWEMEVTI